MKRENNTIQAFVALVSGVVFGVGLAMSEMINPQRVLGFLDIAGLWDPTLAFVMGGALLLTLPAFQLARKWPAPLCAARFSLPVSKALDKRLITGSALFGIGWGIVGFCPGPALAALVTGRMDVLIFVISMISGMILFSIWDKAVAG